MSEPRTGSLTEEIAALRRNVIEQLASWERQLAAGPQAVVERVAEAVETAEERRAAPSRPGPDAAGVEPGPADGPDAGDRASGAPEHDVSGLEPSALAGPAGRPAERAGGRSGAVSPSVGRNDGG